MPASTLTAPERSYTGVYLSRLAATLRETAMVPALVTVRMELLAYRSKALMSQWHTVSPMLTNTERVLAFSQLHAIYRRVASKTFPVYTFAYHPEFTVSPMLPHEDTSNAD